MTARRLCTAIGVALAATAILIGLPRMADAQMKPGAYIVHLPGLDEEPGFSGMPTASYGVAINESGVVAGYSFVRRIDGPAHPVKTAAVWRSRDAVVRGIALTSMTTDGESEATGINASGEVVGWVMRGSTRRAILWRPQSDGTYAYVDLGTLGGPESVALGINDSGKVIGWSHVADQGFRWAAGFPCEPVARNASYTPCHYRHAFLWTPPGGMEDLGVPQMAGGSPRYESRAKAINNRDQIVGDDGNDLSPFSTLWIGGSGYSGYIGTPNAIADLPEPNAVYGVVQQFAGVTGRTVGRTWYWGSSLTPNDPGPILYDKGLKVTTAPALTNATALSVNDAGAVVGSGFAGDASAQPSRAFLRHGGWILDLYADQQSQGSGWEPSTAADINSAGDIVGTGTATHLKTCTPAGTCASPVQAFVLRSPDNLCEYALSASNVLLGPKAVSVPIAVTTESVCRWSAVPIPHVPTWLGQPSMPEDGLHGNGSVTFDIAADDGSGGVSAVNYEVAGHLVRFTRYPFVRGIFSPASTTVAASGGSGTTQFAASFGYGWTARASATWLNLTSATSGVAGAGAATFAYTVDPNPSVFERTAYLLVTMDNGTWAFTVTQRGAPGGSISGTVTSGGIPLAGVSVVAYTESGAFAAFAGSTSTGNYTLTVGAGSYRVRTFSGGLYIDEAWDNVQCVQACTGGLVAVTSGNTTSGINFDLSRRDSKPPVIHSVMPSVTSLGPPNHKLVPISVAIVATDDSGVSPVCKVVRVSSNEPEEGAGDGDSSPDATIVGANEVMLRAERSGQGTGRVYTITVECRDGAGLAASASATVSVAHDNRK